MHTLIGRRIVMLRPAEIRSAGFTARRHFDRYELQRLADSIAANGVIEPLIVRKNSGSYELIAGERRLRAAKMAGLRRIPCVIHKANSTVSALYAMLENIQRKPLDPFEEAEALNGLYHHFGISQTEIALRMGMTSGQLADKLCFLQLSPELQKKIRQEELCEAQIEKLMRLPVSERAARLELMIGNPPPAEQPNPPPAAEPVQIKEPVPEEPVRKSSIGDLRIFANSLYKLVDTTQNAGINLQVRKSENEKYVEYRVKIHKESLKNGCHQLKIC